MQYTLHIFNASGRLGSIESAIKTTFDEAIKTIGTKIDAPSIDVGVFDNPDMAIPETGVGGEAISSHIMLIHIDPTFVGIEKVIDSEIKSTFAHELHHCARMHACGYGKTLLEAAVSEGLADHFDIEMNGGNPKPWSVAVTGSDLDKVKQMAIPEYNEKEYDHAAWFYGSPKRGLPRWAGYSLGYHIVKEYLEKTGKKASALVAEKADSFIS